MLHTLNSTVMISLVYALPAVTLTEEECTRIMSPILKNVLNKLQIVITIKRDVSYVPTAFQGMELHNVYTLMGAIHCAMTVNFFRTNIDLGHLLKMSYDCMSMELGLPHCPFQYDYQRYSGCVTHSWMKHLWHFYNKKNIEIRRVYSNFKHNRKNDIHFMRCFANNGIHGY